MLVAVGLCGALTGPLMVSAPVGVYDEGTWVASRTSPAVVFEQASDRHSTQDVAPPGTPAGSSAPVGGGTPAGGGDARPDDLARAIAGLRSIPTELSVPALVDPGPQTAPVGADRR